MNRPADADSPPVRRVLQQERSRTTRSVLLHTAALEFSRHGFAAASVNTILADCGRTKGAMYFHFTSKMALAQAVLDQAQQLYTRIGQSWSADGDVPALDALAGIVDDIASAFATEPAMRAEARMSLEPKFHPFIDTRANRAWEPAGLELATAAYDSGVFKAGFTP